MDSFRMVIDLVTDNISPDIFPEFVQKPSDFRNPHNRCTCSAQPSELTVERYMRRRACKAKTAWFMYTFY